MNYQQLKIKSANLLQDFNGGVQLVFSIDRELINNAKLAVQNANEWLTQGKEVGVTVERITRRRSLDANAYFHVLCDKIADKLHLSMDEVKVNLVTNYGTPKYIVSVPKDADITDMWAYARFIDETDEQARYMLYKPTHTLTTSEMARLIDGAIQEAQQLGIETITPRELAELEQQWEQRYGDKKTGSTAENAG